LGVKLGHSGQPKRPNGAKRPPEATQLALLSGYAFRTIVNGDIGGISQEIDVADLESFYGQVCALPKILEQLGR
jgi:hypothetical protein